MRFNTLDQWLDWQLDLHPSEIELGLQRVAAVWRRLSPRGLRSRVVTVAGTNGKGSCVAMIDAVYRRAGYRVATYTSPHLVRYNERIKLDGVAVDDRSICEAFEAVDRARDNVTLTYFEFGTLAALYLFAQNAPDLVILEVGLGGRLDAVNIIDADLAVITTIDIDHKDWLGETREEIGREKAGIMRPQRPVVLADPAMPHTLFEEAERRGAEVLAAGADYTWNESPKLWCWHGPDGVSFDLPLPGLKGGGQLQNAAAVVMACQRLKGDFDIPESALSRGLAEVQLPGRLHLLPGKPSLLLDVAHNRQSVEGLAVFLDQIAPQARIQAVFGLLHDKDPVAVADIMGGRVDGWHLTDLPGNRGRSSIELAKALRSAGIAAPIHTFAGVVAAFQSARTSTQENDMILVFGSFRVVGEVMHYLGIE
ncbi:MAG: bifunctional tetrahydrofolate synthase/dihydrofolate synthase [Chromatiales bacterium]|jgi:dihydrofolate synthase/folylpolyglutamate synthase